MASWNEQFHEVKPVLWCVCSTLASVPSSEERVLYSCCVMATNMYFAPFSSVCVTFCSHVVEYWCTPLICSASSICPLSVGLHKELYGSTPPMFKRVAVAQAGKTCCTVAAYLVPKEIGQRGQQSVSPQKMYCKVNRNENDHVTLRVNDVVRNEVIMYVSYCTIMTM